jgi:uncharacterized protein YcnI
MRYLVITLALFAATAGVASAHVTVHPNRLPAGEFTTMVVRVPSEEADASTTKVDVQLPKGFFFVSTAPVPGWTAKIVERKLAKPVKMGDDTATTEVGEVIWSGGAIAPEQYLEFPLSVAIPDTPGAMLTFKAIQTYSNGKVVRWIGTPDAAEPAPQVAVIAKNAAIEDVPAGPTVAAAATASSSNDNGRANLALGLGIAGLVAGLLALGVALMRRRAA